MKLIVLLIIMMPFIACNNQQDQDAQHIDESRVIAMVGDEVITADFLKAFLYANNIDQVDEYVVNQALETLINEVAMANIAKKKQLTLTTEQRNHLKYIKLKSMAEMAKEDYMLDHLITENDIKNEYNNANQMAGNLQYRIHHMLFDDEVAAIKKLESIKSSADYKYQQEAYLKRNSDKRNVGDLGWVTLGQLPKSFREVLPDVENDTVIKDVVNSQFGAHVVYLESTRLLEPPKYEDVKQGIINSLKTQKLNKFTQLARAKSKVVVTE